MIKMGLLGGTFDPVHLGHLTVAEDVLTQLSLSRIMFIPDRQPSLKTDRNITPVEHRLAMLKLAVGKNQHFKVSTSDFGRTGPSYSVDIVSVIKNELGSSVDLFFIAGLDALMKLSMWKDPLKLIQLCRIVAIGRPDSPTVNLKALEETLPGISSRVSFVEVTQIDISSTQIRERVNGGCPITSLVPPAVEEYIFQNRLYS